MTLNGDEQHEQVMEELQMLCAVVDLSSSSYDVILPVDVVDELRDMPSLNVMRLPVTVPHDVTFQVQTGDVASTVVVDSTVKEGQPICQLCVPESKRVQVLKLVHDSVFGCHLRECKVSERDHLLSYWPTVCQSMHSYDSSCTSCRLRSRPTKADPCTTSQTLMLIVFSDDTCRTS